MTGDYYARPMFRFPTFADVRPPVPASWTQIECPHCGWSALVPNLPGQGKVLCNDCRRTFPIGDPTVERLALVTGVPIAAAQAAVDSVAASIRLHADEEAAEIELRAVCRPDQLASAKAEAERRAGMFKGDIAGTRQPETSLAAGYRSVAHDVALGRWP